MWGGWLRSQAPPERLVHVRQVRKTKDVVDVLLGDFATFLGGKTMKNHGDSLQKVKMNSRSGF